MTLIELLIVVVIMPIVVGGIAVAIIRYPSERDDDFQSDRRQCRCPDLIGLFRTRRPKRIFPDDWNTHFSQWELSDGELPTGGQYTAARPPVERDQFARRLQTEWFSTTRLSNHSIRLSLPLPTMGRA